MEEHGGKTGSPYTCFWRRRTAFGEFAIRYYATRMTLDRVVQSVDDDFISEKFFLVSPEGSRIGVFDDDNYPFILKSAADLLDYLSGYIERERALVQKSLDGE
jgi:hypothetical protein